MISNCLTTFFRVFDSVNNALNINYSRKRKHKHALQQKLRPLKIFIISINYSIIGFTWFCVQFNSTYSIRIYRAFFIVRIFQTINVIIQPCALMQLLNIPVTFFRMP